MDEERPDAHLRDVADGCGCTEIWEHTSEARTDEEGGDEGAAVDGAAGGDEAADADDVADADEAANEDDVADAEA